MTDDGRGAGPDGGLPAWPGSDGSDYLRETSTSRIDVSFGSSVPQRRWTILLRLLLVVPHFFVLLFLAIPVVFLTFLSWFAALALGRLPRAFVPLLVGFQRWETRVLVYTALLTDHYPPFSLGEHPDYPVRYAAEPGALNRSAVFFRLILVIPAALFSWLLTTGLISVMVVIWLIALILGRLPEPLFKAEAAVVRYAARYAGYYNLISAEWPWGSFGDVRPLHDDWSARSATEPPEESSWNLYLSPAAKFLVALFIVLGAVWHFVERSDVHLHNSTGNMGIVMSSNPHG